MTFTPVRLLRLYPRYWRERYGEEFLALLESTDLTRPLVIDVVRAAAREWLARTFTGRVVSGLAISSVALIFALGFRALVGPPAWAALLGASPGLLTAAVALRLLVVLLRRSPRVSSGELRIWLLALFVGAVGAEWAGLAADLLFPIWGWTALQVVNCLIQLLLAGDGYPNDPRLVPLTPRSTAPPARPLGLFEIRRPRP